LASLDDVGLLSAKRAVGVHAGILHDPVRVAAAAIVVGAVVADDADLSPESQAAALLSPRFGVDVDQVGLKGSRSDWHCPAHEYSMEEAVVVAVSNAGRTAVAAVAAGVAAVADVAAGVAAAAAGECPPAVKAPLWLPKVRK
jgi:hypothetical protein